MKQLSDIQARDYRGETTFSELEVRELAKGLSFADRYSFDR